MSRDAQVAYIQLFNLDGMGFPLPASPDRLAAMMGLPLQAITEVFDKLGWLFTTDRDHIHHIEVSEAREKASELSEKRQAFGRRGGRATAANRTQANATANATSNCCSKPVIDDVSDSARGTPAENIENPLNSDSGGDS